MHVKQIDKEREKKNNPAGTSILLVTAKITTDTILYSERQYQNELIEFEKGQEELLPIVKNKYKDNVKNYYIQKLKPILEKEKLEYDDYYEFYASVSNITNTFGKNDYDSTDYLLNYNLTTDKFDDYYKKIIMEHLLQVIKDL